MTRDRTRGTPGFLERRPGASFTLPSALPANFLYFGAGPFLGHLDVMIKQYGIRVNHTHGIACPCTILNEFGGTGHPQPACSDCGGLGVVFVDAHTRKLRALASEFSTDDQSLDTGQHTSGQLRVTFPSGHIADSGDRLVFPDIIVPLRFMRRYDARVGGFRIPFDVHDVEAIATKGRRPEDPLTSLVRGKDYGLDPKKRFIEMKEGGAVSHGMTVSASLMGVPDYIVTTSMHISRGRLDGLGDDAEHITLPKFFTAVRADILIGQQKDEVSSFGDVDG